MQLSDDDMVILRRCMDAVIRDASLASEYFHEELFRLAPETRQLYKMDLKRQGPLLMNRLGVIMSRMHDTEALRPFVEDMARRHVGYGVQQEHYPIVKQALITAFRRILGPKFSEEAEEVLGDAYDSVAAIMIDSSYPPAQTHTH